MHYMKDFCRVCLRSEILMQDLKKNLNDENSDVLLTKLQTCVTEVVSVLVRVKNLFNLLLLGVVNNEAHLDM